MLFNLKGKDIVHWAAALRMFTTHIEIQKIVEDLQLGVKSYQKKLNISKPRTRDEDLSRITTYTTLSNHQGVIYEDKLYRWSFPRSSQNWRDLPKDIPLNRIEVHRYVLDDDDGKISKLDGGSCRIMLATNES
ncbi:hypothetical protein Tco_0169696 [Tanacetum coccineum]